MVTSCHKSGGVAGPGIESMQEVRLEAAGDKVVCLQPECLHEPAIARHGEFVMNTEEIQQVFLDYQLGRLGQIEGSEARYTATDAAVKKQKETGSWKQ